MQTTVTNWLVALTLPVLIGVVIGTRGMGQEPDTVAPSDIQKRTQEIVSQMSRKEHEVREVFGRRVEKFRAIRSEPDIKANLEEYAGTYEVGDCGYVLTLSHVGKDGKVEGGGSEKLPEGTLQTSVRRFILRDTRIHGALLTGTRRYEDGATAPIEGVFIIRTERHSPIDSGIRASGFGMIGTPVKTPTGTHQDKLFYQRRGNIIR